MNTIVSGSADIIALVFLFGLVIFVHEFGHYLAARMCGLVVETFSIGFGPAIWQKKVKGITYKIGCLPIGGYVALPQLDPSGMATIQGGKTDGGKKDETPAEADEEAVEYPPIKPWKKIVVSIAGPLGNVILAVFLAWVIYLAPTENEIEKGNTMVGSVETNCPAYEQGLRPGDTILAVNGRPVSSWSDYVTDCHLYAKTNSVSLTVLAATGATGTLSLATEKIRIMGLKIVPGVGPSSPCYVTQIRPNSPAMKAGFRAGDLLKFCNGKPVFSDAHFMTLIAENPNREMSFSVERDGKDLEIKVTPLFNHTIVSGRPMIGVTPVTIQRGVQWMQYKDPWDQIAADAGAIKRILGALLTREQAGQAAGALGGPVIIFLALWNSIQTSLLNAVGFIRFLCVNLAILNLLPLPVLDGGHIVFALWEMVTRRKPHPKVVNILVNGFAGLLIAVFALLMLRDCSITPRILESFGRQRDTEAQAREKGPAAHTNVVLSTGWTTNPIPPVLKEE